MFSRPYPDTGGHKIKKPGTPFFGRGYAAAALCAIVLFVYGNTLFSGFVLDDQDLIIKKSGFFSRPANALAIFTLRDTTVSSAKAPYYRPVNTLSYMLDHYLWGLHPFWYHLENVLLHAGVVVLLYLLLLEAFEDWRLAFFAAVLFAVYPVNAEAVDTVFNRNTLFCAAFSLASLLLLAKKRKVLPPLAYFLALLSKEQAVVLPLFLASLWLTGAGAPIRDEPGGNGRARKRNGWRAPAVFFAAALLYFFIRRSVLGVFTGNQGMPFNPARFKFMSAVLFENFRLMLFPFRLNANYSLLQVYFTPLRAAAAVSGLSALVFFSVFKRAPAPVRAGSQWILWGLLPISNIVMIPSAPVAERYLYIILPGFALIMGYALSVFYKKKAAWAAATLVLLSLALGVRTFTRNFAWKDNISVYKSMIRSDPGNPEDYYYLAVSLYTAGRLEESKRMFGQALRLQPDYPRARSGLGFICLKNGDFEGAEKQFREAAGLQPDYIAARLDLAIVLLRLRRYGAALPEFQKVLSLDPRNISALNGLGAIYAIQGRIAKARREFREILAADPGNTQAVRGMEYLSGIKGRYKGQSQ